MSVYQFVRAKKAGDPFAKAVLIALAHYANWEWGHCFPSAQTIANDCECTEKTVRTKLEYLVQKGLISIQQRPGKTPVITLTGYREWFLESEKRAGATPVSLTDPTQLGRSGNPGKPYRGTPESYDATPVSHAMTPVPGTDELIIEQYNNYNIQQDRATSVDAWEASPPPPSKSSEVKWASDQIENPSSPVVHLPSGEAREIAKRAALKAAADKISTAQWPFVRRDENPKEFAAWMNWFEANDCKAQLHLSTIKGMARVPHLDVDKGAEIFRRKYLFDRPAQVG
jgi:hypothetical protein